METAVFLVCLFSSALGANILAVTTLASPSHHIWHKAYFRGLLERGHNVTVLGHDTEKAKIENFTMLTLEGVYDKLRKDFILENLIDVGPLQSIKLISDLDEQVCKYDMETKALQTLLNYPKNYKFDLIIWDLNGGRCLYHLIDIFGTPPVIATSPFGIQPFIGYPLGHHIYSYIPFYQMYTTDRMNFLDRLINFFYVNMMNLYWRYCVMPREYELAKEFFGGNVRSPDEMQRNFSLLLANTDPVLNFPEPLPPNIISVGGIHVGPPKKLPKDLQQILDEAKQGVILVALGTNLNWDKIGKPQREAFFEAFRKLPYLVLMKSRKEETIFPKNVMVRQWLPQNDVLAQPNIKLFITHGGALSTQEAMYHGVPVVGMPFYLDQHNNMAKINARSLGQLINYFEVTSDTLMETIIEVITNPKYRLNMQLLSKLYKDQPQTALEKAVFWTEYVLRHRTGEHLSPATRDMFIFQRYDLDIALAIIIALIIFSVVVWKVIRMIYEISLKGSGTSKQKLS